MCQSCQLLKWSYSHSYSQARLEYTSNCATGSQAVTVQSSKICRAEAMLRVHCYTSVAYNTPTAGVAGDYPMSAGRVAVCAPAITAEEEEEVEVDLAFGTGLLERQNTSLVATVAHSVMGNHPWGEKEMP